MLLGVNMEVVDIPCHSVGQPQLIRLQSQMHRMGQGESLVATPSQVVTDIHFAATSYTPPVAGGPCALRDGPDERIVDYVFCLC
jgi:hypothetical protein